jgi:hypothetical protein
MRGFIIIGCLIIGCGVGNYVFLESWFSILFFFAGVWLLFLLGGRLLSMAGHDSKVSGGMPNSRSLYEIIRNPTDRDPGRTSTSQPLPEERSWKPK